MTRFARETFDYFPFHFATINESPTLDTTIKLAGLGSMKCRAAKTDYAQINMTPTTERTYYYRFYIYFDSSVTPSSNYGLFRISDATGTMLEVSLQTSKKFSCFNAIASANIGVTSPEVAPETWYCVEVKVKVPAAGNAEPAWRVLRPDGTTFHPEQKASGSLRNLGAKNVRFGGQSGSAGVAAHYDAAVINDDQGSRDNSWVGSVIAEPPSQPTATACYWGANMDGDVALIESKAERADAPFGGTGIETWNLFEEHAKRTVGVVHYADPSNTWVWDGYGSGATGRVNERGAIPMKTIGLSETTLAEIIAGAKDTAIRTWAEAAKAFGRPLFLRYLWEFNGTWWSWGQSPEYVAAWRHVFNVIRPIAPNVTFVWCPNVLQNGGAADPDLWYPGDAYVDWVAMDGYVGTQPKKNEGWTSAFARFKITYDRLREIAPSKPIAIVEVGASETGGNKAEWLTELLGLMPTQFPQIKAFLYYNEYAEHEAERITWPIESSPAATSAFATGIAPSYFLGGGVAGSLTAGQTVPSPPYTPPAPTPPAATGGATQPPLSGTPKLAVPLRMGSAGLARVEQDTSDEIAACVYALMATERGARLEEADYGVADPTFDPLPLDLGEALAQISIYEPRAEVETAQDVERELVKIGVVE